jgi:hypothetical protein
MKGTMSHLPSHDIIVLQNEAKELFYFKFNRAAFKPFKPSFIPLISAFEQVYS